MFGKVTEQLAAVVEELHGCRRALHEVARLTDSVDVSQEFRARLDALEGPLRAKLLEVEATLNTAESLKQTARNAEERSRGMLARAETLTAQLAEGDEANSTHLSDEDMARLLEGDGEGSGEDRVQRVLSDVERLAMDKFSQR